MLLKLNKILIQIFVSVLILVTSSSAQFYANISGKVLFENRIPVPNAQVSYYDSNLNEEYLTYTDQDGNYSFHNVILNPSDDSDRPLRNYTGISGSFNSLGAASAAYFVNSNRIENIYVFNILGQKVKTLKIQYIQMSDGSWLSSSVWDGKNSSGLPVTSGRYFIAAADNGQIMTVPVLHLSDGGIKTSVSSKGITQIEDDITAQIGKKTLGTLTSRDKGVDFTVTISPDPNGIQFNIYETTREIKKGFNEDIVDEVFSYPNRILFIGNSYTSANGGVGYNLRDMIKYAHPDWDIHIEQSTLWGASLAEHVNDENTKRIIENGKWDLVILQGSSWRPALRPDLMSEDARIIDGWIKGSGSETGFFLTWDYNNIGEPMILKLIEAYTGIAEELGAIVIPCGIAWENAELNDPETNLYVKDDYHPNARGTYLAVCTFYASLTGDNPMGINYLEDFIIPIEVQEYLQKIAWNTVQEFSER